MKVLIAIRNFFIGLGLVAVVGGLICGGVYLITSTPVGTWLLNGIVILFLFWAFHSVGKSFYNDVSKGKFK